MRKIVEDVRESEWSTRKEYLAQRAGVVPHCHLVNTSLSEESLILGSFKYAIEQISDPLTKKLVVGEFVHSLNRKEKILNADVDECIEHLMGD